MEQGFAGEEFCTGFPVCDERSAGAVSPAAAQHVEPLWIAVCSVYADLRTGHFEGKRADTRIADELRGGWSGDRRVAICGANALQRVRAADRDDVDDLRGVPALFFPCQDVLPYPSDPLPPSLRAA